jgi:hypothetical protein
MQTIIFQIDKMMRKQSITEDEVSIAINAIVLKLIYSELDNKCKTTKKLRNSQLSLNEYKKMVESKNYAILLNRKIYDERDLIATMCIAYSWMPTMLEIHGKPGELKNLSRQLSNLGNVELDSEAEKKIIRSLARITNNSLVGAIKTLHLLDHNRYPLIDSRVLVGWKILFETEIKDKLVHRLGTSWNFGENYKRLDKLIENYFYYRAFLRLWAGKLKNGVTPRDIEFRLYLLGDKVK